MYKVWYIPTKKSDINIILSIHKSNFTEWGIEKEKDGFAIHLGKCHIYFTKYPYETKINYDSSRSKRQSTLE